MSRDVMAPNSFPSSPAFAGRVREMADSVAAGYQYYAIPRDLLSPDGARMNEAARARRVCATPMWR